MNSKFTITNFQEYQNSYKVIQTKPTHGFFAFVNHTIRISSFKFHHYQRFNFIFSKRIESCVISGSWKKQSKIRSRPCPRRKVNFRTRRHRRLSHSTNSSIRQTGYVNNVASPSTFSLLPAEEEEKKVNRVYCGWKQIQTENDERKKSFVFKCSLKIFRSFFGDRTFFFAIKTPSGSLQLDLQSKLD